VTRNEAKEVLLLYRPGVADEGGSEIDQALEVAKNDAVLGSWFKEHCAFQEALAAKFQEISVPEGLREQILSERKVHVASGFQRRAAVLVAAAAVCCVCIGFVIYSLQPHEDYSWSNFRNRMVSMVLREYPKMDLETSDLAQVREFLSQKRAPGNYVLPKKLEKASATGCAVVSWKGSAVSMVCFNSGTKAGSKDPDLYLFVIDPSAVKHAPAAKTTDISQVSLLSTASWTSHGVTYLLAGEGNSEFIGQYLPDRLD
jgi:hypothetical protein